MPKFVDSPQKEAKWKRAKRAVVRAKGKKKKDFTSRDWGLTTHIFQRIKKAQNKNEFYAVYYVSPKTGKPIVMQAHDDLAKAKEHLQEFKKRYGKFVQAGIEEVHSAQTKARAVQDFSNTNAKKLNSSIKKCMELVKRKK